MVKMTTFVIYILPQFLINNVIYQNALNFTLKWENCMVCEFYLNKVVFKNLDIRMDHSSCGCQGGRGEGGGGSTGNYIQLSGINQEE